MPLKKSQILVHKLLNQLLIFVPKSLKNVPMESPKSESPSVKLSQKSEKNLLTEFANSDILSGMELIAFQILSNQLAPGL